MGNSLNQANPMAVPLPITEQSRIIAHQFAQAHPDTLKAAQVQLNTLAVSVVDDYFQMMDIPTDLGGSDSWNPFMQMMANVADLNLPEVGKLECRPIKTGALTCCVPPEVWSLRVGYVVIEIDDAFQTAQLLGFTPAVTEEELPLSQLQPPEALLDHLYALRQTETATQSESFREGQSEIKVAIATLSQWLNNAVDQTLTAGWQAIDELLNLDSLTPAFSFRSVESGPTAPPEIETLSTEQPDFRRAKLIDLTLQLGQQQVVLVVELQAELPDKTNIGFQVHPAGGQPYLSPDLELAILDASGDVFMEAQSRQADNYIQLQFSGTSSELFQVRITLGCATYIEEFVV